jgi:hypothetical protein
MARRAVLAATAALLLFGLLAPTASAQMPEFERIDVDFTFEDTDLSAACGFTVLVHLEGQVILRTFGDGRLLRLSTVNVAATATGNDNTFRFRDVGADLILASPKGDEILLIIGQVPFGFTGVLKVNLTTGETILEPHHSLEGDVEELCAALAGD